METQITSHQEIAALAMAYESLRMIGGTELGVQIRAEVAKACRYAGDLGEVRWEDLNSLIQRRAFSGEASINCEIQGRLTLAILQRHCRGFQEWRRGLARMGLWSQSLMIDTVMRLGSGLRMKVEESCTRCVWS